MTGEITSNEPLQSGTSECELPARRPTIGHLTREAVQVDRNSWLALIDQGIVSGISLIASVIVGRTCGADGLGLYALGMTFFVLFTGLQTAIISTPYTVLRSRRTGADEEKRFAGSSLAGLVLVSLLAVGILGVLYLVFYFLQAIPGFDSIVLAVMLLVPFLMMRDFSRRYAFAHYQLGAAVAIDFSVFVIQLGTLLIFAWMGFLTPVTAFVCLALGCGISALVWLIKNKTEFQIDLTAVKSNLMEQWVLGRWVLMELLMAITGCYLVHWLLIFLMDSTATGVFAACLVVVNLSSPFLQGMGNILSPKFATAAADVKTTSIQHIYLRSTLFMTGVMVIFVIGCVLFGELVMEFLYPEAEYAGHGLIIILLAFRALVGSTSITAHHALVAMHQPRLSFWCTLLGVATALVLGLILIPPMGIAGGAIAMVIGTVIEVLAIYFAYKSVLRNYVFEPVAGTVESI